MKLLFLIFSSCLSISLHAQQGFSTTGGEASGTAGSSSFSVGQMAYSTYAGSNGSVAQGVQQTYDITALLGDGEQDYLDYSGRAYRVRAVRAF